MKCMVGGEHARTRKTFGRNMTRKTFVRNRIHGIHKFKDKEILFVVFDMIIFFPFFFSFLVWGN